MRVLLTGGTGFLGREILRQLLARDDDVTALVRPHGGVAAERLAAAGCGQRIHVVAGGLDDTAALARGCDGADVVIHLALAVADGADDPEETNITGARNVVDACLQAGVRRLVLASSVAVYGLRHPAGTGPLRETSPLSGSLKYARSKITAEQIGREAASAGRLEVIVLRPELVYGLGGAAFESIVRRVAAHPLRAAAHGLRDTLQPIHLRDAAQAFVLATTVNEIDRSTINVAGTEHVTHAAFARLIHGSLGGPAMDHGQHVEVLPSLKYDIRRARCELGFEPQISLRRGVPESVRALQRGTTPLQRIELDPASMHASGHRRARWRAQRPVQTAGWWR